MPSVGWGERVVQRRHLLLLSPSPEHLLPPPRRESLPLVIPSAARCAEVTSWGSCCTDQGMASRPHGGVSRSRLRCNNNRSNGHNLKYRLHVRATRTPQDYAGTVLLEDDPGRRAWELGRYPCTSVDDGRRCQLMVGHRSTHAVRLGATSYARWGPDGVAHVERDDRPGLGAARRCAYRSVAARLRAGTGTPAAPGRTQPAAGHGGYVFPLDVFHGARRV